MVHARSEADAEEAVAAIHDRRNEACNRQSNRAHNRAARLMRLHLSLRGTEDPSCYVV
nr:hypothetical protein [Mesorhizobium camelthorni]